jgi:hypothetical protein
MLKIKKDLFPELLLGVFISSVFPVSRCCKIVAFAECRLLTPGQLDGRGQIEYIE